MKELWQRITGAGGARRMRLCETLSLGERRFLAVVRVDDEQFLIGGAGNSISLLTRLPAREGAGPAATEG